MKLFDKAILKLTAIYSGILLIICLGFSSMIFMIASSGLDHLPTMRSPVADFQDDTAGKFRVMIRERDTEVKRRLLMNLIMVNIFVITSGVVASYFLARLTLKPIKDNMESQKRFVANASHELRTPLTAIAMENEVTLRAKSPTKNELSNQVKSNMEEVKKLQKLTSNLLELSQNESVVMKKVDAKKLVDSTITQMQKIAEQKKIVIKNQIKSLKLEANYDMLSEILSIVLDNAIKYSPRNSTVIIKSKQGKIAVVDEGPGISSEDINYVFERFYRAEKSHTTDGYGLGLSIAKHLANQMKMEISAQNNTDKGTTFNIG
jgi:Signal transduction histidine kinase